MNQCISWDYPDLEDVAFHHSGDIDIANRFLIVMHLSFSNA